jgi:peptidoglycan/LPS O-acetylase OafA/YrhL
VNAKAITTQTKNHPKLRFAYLWSVIFALWSGTVIAVLSPFLKWHHHPIQAGLIQGCITFFVALILSRLFLYFLNSKLSIETESKNIHYIPRLDHLRFLAAVLVVLYHYYHNFIPQAAVVPGIFNEIINQGSSGVDLFFVLSGFIFGTIAYEKRIHYGNFIISRIFRIYPLYIFAVTIAVSVHYNLFNALDSLLLIFPFLQVNHIAGNLNDFGQLWSVGLEFQFYLIFPFLAEFIIRFGYRYLIALILVALALRLFYFEQTGSVRDLVYWSLPGRIDEFALGILATVLSIKNPSYFKNPFHLIISLALVALSFHWLNSWGGFYNGANSGLWIIWPSFEGIIWGYFIISYLRANITIPDFLNKSLSNLGHLSFSIYVMHGFAVFLTIKYFSQHHMSLELPLDTILLGVLICVPLSIIIALPTFHFIEKPFFVFKKKYTDLIPRNR